MEKKRKNKRKMTLRSLFFILSFVSFLALSGEVQATALSMTNIKTISGGKFVKKSNGEWVYKKKDGKLIKNSIVNINGRTYYFSEKGYRQSGWQKLSGKSYYFGKKSEGYMYKKKWLVVDNTHRYYLKSNGVRATGWMTASSGNKYYFNKNGVRYYGWHIIKGVRYYFGKASEGKMYTSTWIISNGNKYYVKKDGSMTIGWLTKSGNRYYFDEEGRVVTGKRKISEQDYYFDSNGKLLYRGPKLNIYSDCAILVEANSGKIIYSKNEKTAHANASTTKIMTCILALEKGSLSDKITVSANATKIPSGAVKLGMKKGDRFTKRDLLYSLMLPSHNDTAIALAEYVNGSTTNFVKKMNEKARALGCTNTNFVTPNGLDSGVNHYSTALDLSKIARYAMKNSTFRQIIATSSYSFKSGMGYSYKVYTTNKLLGKTKGVIGMKTGYTKKAGNCFVGAVKAKNGKMYISVTLGATTETKRWSDAKTLLQYAYNLN